MAQNSHNHSNMQPPSVTSNSTDEKAKETAISVDTDTPFLKKNPDDDDDPDVSYEDEEDYETRLKTSDCVGRQVLRLQHGTKTILEWMDVKTKGQLSFGIFALLYFAYFAYAMYYRFGDEPSIRLLWCTLLGVVIATRHKVYQLVGITRCAKWWLGDKSPTAAARIRTVRFFTRWLLYGGIGAFMAYVIVDVGIKEPDRLRSLPGLFVFVVVCFLFSSHPSKIDWHTIYWSMGIQFIMAMMVMKWKGGKQAVLWIQVRLDGFFDNSKPASRLMFGDPYEDHYMVFGALPILFLTNATLSMLYYVGAMQFLVKAIGTFLQFVLDTAPIESTGVAASIFMEGGTALLSLRPYLGKVSNSELFALVTACLASIGGAFLAILAQLGMSVEFMLPAMVISAPSTFAVCKLMEPETRKSQKTKFSGELPPEMRHQSILDAAQAGAVSVVTVVANIIVTAFAFFALIEFVNTTIAWFGDRVGIDQLSIEKIMSYIFYPFALMMGVDLADCRTVGMLMGLRVSSTNFVSMLKMKVLVANRDQLQEYSLIPNATVSYVGDHIVLDQWNVTLIDGIISRRSEAIATYALCGFSSVLSLSITISILSTLVPKRQKWVVSRAMPLLIAGNLANFMVGCFAGLLL